MTSDRKGCYFSPVIDKYFADWILKGTWHTKHALDEQRFYRFVLAIHKLSKRVNSVRGKGRFIKTANGQLRENGFRNPRTTDREGFKAKVIQAVTRNHGFNADALERLATHYADRAMDILDFLWETRNAGIPDAETSKWNPPLR